MQQDTESGWLRFHEQRPRPTRTFHVIYMGLGRREYLGAIKAKSAAQARSRALRDVGFCPTNLDLRAGLLLVRTTQQLTKELRAFVVAARANSLPKRA